MAMLISCTLQGCVNENEPEGVALTVGDSLPEFSVIMTDGTVVSKASLKGKRGVLVFFNTDCSDCRKELPIVQQLWDKYKNNPDVVIALIAREETAEHIAAYWEANGFTMPYSPQEDREVYSLFAPSVIPRIYITDTKGIITFSSGDTDMPDLKELEDNLM